MDPSIRWDDELFCESASTRNQDSQHVSINKALGIIAFMLSLPLRAQARLRINFSQRLKHPKIILVVTMLRPFDQLRAQHENFCLIYD
jgi:hypothetical protein